MDASEEEEAWLEASDGKRHALHGSSSLGRSDANRIVLESRKVSRQHALIHLQNIGEFWLIDFGSSNGTFLNKRRIHHPVRLSDGDQITVGLSEPAQAKLVNLIPSRPLGEHELKGFEGKYAFFAV